jgi:hypothetical protein
MSHPNSKHSPEALIRRRMRSIRNNMIRRCHNPADNSYVWYGAKGVAVCQRWRTSVDAFIADLGICPPGMSIERIDGSRGYEPGNVRWATPAEQSRNRSCVRNITLHGETMCAAEWAVRTGLTAVTIRSRLRRGCTAEEALAPLRRRARLTLAEYQQLLADHGAGGTHAALSRKFGLSRGNVSRHIRAARRRIAA